MVFETEFKMLDGIIDDQRCLDHQYSYEELDERIKNLKGYMQYKYGPAIEFFKHMKNHIEVINALVNPGIPMCKICNKSAVEIYCERKWK